MSIQSTPPHQLLFVNDEGILLSRAEQEVLARLFVGYERLVVKSELGGGFGGGRVLLVRPITAVSADLPAIVKLGQAVIIQQEWEAFSHYVQRKVPKVAQIEGEPQFTADSSWGGIRYPLVGDGYFSIESLGAFCRRADDEDVLYVLEHQLFPSLGALWQGSQPVHEYAFGRSLDAMLPVNLVVTYRKLGTAALAPDREQQWEVGDEVTLSNLLLTEVDSVAGELTLDLPPDENNPAGGWRIRVTAVPNVGDYQIGEMLLQPISGVIAATRNTIFQTQLAHIFNTSVSATTDTFTLPETGSLPNPIVHLPAILKQRGDVRVGIVHGDLNLENVLVEFDHKSRNIHLIDFANARGDWILHDLLRLETNVWLHLVPEEMKRHGRSLADLSHLVASLQTAVAHPDQIEIPVGLAKSFHILLAIRRQAQHLLMSPQIWDAYWQGLTAYLVGALKFHNLGRLSSAPLPKKVAFVTASLVQQIRQGETTIQSLSTNFEDTQMSNEIPLPDLIHQIHLTLQECEPFESQHQLRAFFAHPQLKSWQNRLPEGHRLTARVNGVVALLQERTHVESNTNALVLMLRVLSQHPNTDEDLRVELAVLADQLEIAQTTESQKTSLEKRSLPSNHSVEDTRIILLEIIETKFNEDELRTLCLHLHVNYESLGGRGMAAKARELILYLERRNRLDDLASSIRRVRPDIKISF